VADDFFEDDDPYFLVTDRLDAGEAPEKVYTWAKKQQKKTKDKVLRDQWDEALHYIEAENPGFKA
jgi:hypothetical protein